MRRLLMVCLMLALAGPALASEQKPGKGVKVEPARATWNTGYFQEALVRRGLEELGYEVEFPIELQNPIFYQSVALGDVDYWTNGWFPNHDGQLPPGFYQKAERVGFVVKAGGLQGYLVSKDAVETYDIESLDDFKRPEVIEAFDQDDDGKAEMAACPPGWGCEQVIAHHMEVYDLDDYIDLIKAAYAASMAEVLAKHQRGEPVFFYTWAPNWTIFKLQPGEDVMWINVPEIIPREAQMPGRDRMTVSGVKGAVTDPLKAGFVVSDIQIVANREFLEENPAAREFFEVFTLPLEDINEQNTLMQDGEDSKSDIQRHVDLWIKKNQEKWDGWLEAARKAAG